MNFCSFCHYFDECLTWKTEENQERKNIVLLRFRFPFYFPFQRINNLSIILGLFSFKCHEDGGIINVWSIAVCRSYFSSFRFYLIIDSPTENRQWLIFKRVFRWFSLLFFGMIWSRCLFPISYFPFSSQPNRNEKEKIFYRDERWDEFLVDLWMVYLCIHYVCVCVTK